MTILRFEEEMERIYDEEEIIFNVCVSLYEGGYCWRSSNSNVLNRGFFFSLSGTTPVKALPSIFSALNDKA